MYQRNVIENITNFIRLTIFVPLSYSSVHTPSYTKSLLKFQYDVKPIFTKYKIYGTR